MKRPCRRSFHLQPLWAKWTLKEGLWKCFRRQEFGQGKCSHNVGKQNCDLWPTTIRGGTQVDHEVCIFYCLSFLILLLQSFTEKQITILLFMVYRSYFARSLVYLNNIGHRLISKLILIEISIEAYSVNFSKFAHYLLCRRYIWRFQKKQCHIHHIFEQDIGPVASLDRSKRILQFLTLTFAVRLRISPCFYFRCIQRMAN